MESYKSFYPTLRQAKTKWSSKSIVSKQGEGPSHDWYEMMKRDAKAKLASSISKSKLGSITHQTRIVHPVVHEDRVAVYDKDTQIQNIRTKETGVKRKKKFKPFKPTDFSRPSLKVHESGPFADPKVRAKWQHTHGKPSEAVKKRAVAMNKAPFDHPKQPIDASVVYHVTHTKHVAKIQKSGIMPMKTSNWVKAGDKDRYGGGEVYAFTHKDDAHRWAGHMDWSHNQKLGSGKISIITAHRPTDRKFEVDHNDPLTQSGSKGQWIKTQGSIEPHHIVSVEKYMPKKLGEDIGLGLAAAAAAPAAVGAAVNLAMFKKFGKTKRSLLDRAADKVSSLKKKKTNEASDKLGKPTPSVEEIAAKHNISVDQVNAQIKKGIEVEKEHTADEGMAHEIARDHLGEFPDYYDRLGAMEKAAKKSVKEETFSKVKSRRWRGALGKYKMMQNDPPVPASKTPSPVPIGYKRFKDGKFNVLRKVEEDVELVEAAGDGNPSNNRGVLHELLVGYHLRGGKHMEKHKDVNGDSPKQAHDKVKSNISPEEYKGVNHRAKAAAKDIAATLGKHGKVHDVHWTSKPGDIQRSTGIKASQKEDASDIVVHTKKGGQIKHHGVSLKVTDSKTAHVPVSNPGLESTHGGEKILAAHRKAIVKAHPAIGRMSNKEERKGYIRAHPAVQKKIQALHSQVLPKFAKHLSSKLGALPTSQLADHLRKHILKANPTPMQKAGHTHLRHTTHGAGGSASYGFSHSDPSKDHEHILKDHKNISVAASGTSVIFSHKGTPFARHRLKLQSQSDPMSTIKGSGELIKGKRSLKEGYDPDKEQIKNRIEAHKSVAEKMAKEHGEQSHEAAFHRALVKRYEKELGEGVEPIDEAAKKLTKKQTRKSWQAMAVRAKKSKNPNAVRDALRAHSKLRNEDVPNGVGGGMSPTIGGEGNIQGTDPIMGKPIRRKKYAGKQVFVVDPTTYHKAYLGKRKFEHYEKYLEGSPMADEIREFARTNWDESIIIENEQTGAMVYLKYGSK